eukprot:TRINITY_DN4328_c0_g1_i2.p1 TRINITY_DN4328_c0_g1~~TRINITY_DN4328_c0_g1_i2.p1  ORF type:complete len:589 (+),score=190.45 TRINITY_DN4328_c0_g1_i2:139-1905(+)
MIQVESDEDEEILLYDKRKLGKVISFQTNQELKTNGVIKKEEIVDEFKGDLNTNNNEDAVDKPSSQEVPNFSIFGEEYSTQQLASDSYINKHIDQLSPLPSPPQQNTYTFKPTPQKTSPFSTSLSSNLSTPQSNSPRANIPFLKRESPIESNQTKPSTPNDGPKFKRLRQLHAEDIDLELEIDDDEFLNSTYSNTVVDRKSSTLPLERSTTTTYTTTPPVANEREKVKEEKAECPFCFKCFPSNEIESHVQEEMDKLENSNKPQPPAPAVNKPKVQTLLQPLTTTNKPTTRSSVDKSNGDKKKKVAKIGDRTQNKPKKNVKKFSNDDIEDIDDSDNDSLKDFIVDDGDDDDDKDQDEIVDSSEEYDPKPKRKDKKHNDHTLTCPYCSQTFSERDFDLHLEEEQERIINGESFSTTTSTSSTTQSSKPKKREQQYNRGSSFQPIDLDDEATTKTEMIDDSDDDGSPVKLHFNAIGNSSSSVNYGAQFDKTSGHKTNRNSNSERTWNNNSNNNHSSSNNNNNNNYRRNSNNNYKYKGKHKKPFNNKKFFAIKNKKKKAYNGSTTTPKSSKSPKTSVKKESKPAVKKEFKM